MNDYPKRPKFFAHRVVRQLFKTCAAQEIGPTATLLVVFVAHTEDAKYYTAPPTFYNDQLIPILGVRKWATLDRARRAAVEAGWLEYVEPPKGTRKAGIYWSTIPERFESIDDSPVGQEPYPQNGYGRGYGRGDGRGDGMGELPTLARNPTPKKESAGAETVPAELIELVDGWNDLPSGIVKQGNGARRGSPSKAAFKGWARSQKDSEQRDAFADIPVLLAAIERAKFCHGQPWFTLPWLFGTNRNAEFNVTKLLSGAHDGNGNGQARNDSPARIR